MKTSLILALTLLAGVCQGLEKEVSLLTKQPVGELAVAGRLSVDLHAEFMVSRTYGKETVLNWYSCGYSGGGSNNTVGGNFGDFGLHVPWTERDNRYPHAVTVGTVRAIRFDGNDIMKSNFGAEPRLAGRQNMAIEIWLRDINPSKGEAILGWQSPDGKESSAPVSSPAGFTGSENWRHLVVNCMSDQEDWYLDGKKIGGGKRATVIGAGQIMVLGGEVADKPSFNGDLAAVRLHDAAMTEEEILHNFQGGVTLGTEMHAWWRTEPDKWWVRESEHFRHCIDKAEMQKWNEKQRQEFENRLPGMFDLAELIYHTYSERLAMRSSVVSRRPEMRGDGIKYSTPIQPTPGGSYMGVDDHFGWACQGAGHINPHELVHGWQAQTGGAMQGNWWEAHANFPQTYNGIYQTMPPDCVTRVCAYFPANGRDYYHERLMFEHLAQTPEYGPMFISKLWYDGATATDKNPYPWSAFIRLDPDPRTSLADEYTRMVQRNVTWDYTTFADAAGGKGNTGRGNDAVPSPVNRYQENAGHARNEILRYARILLQPVPHSPGIWRVPKEMSPQQLGWNICPLRIQAARVSATLAGVVDARRGSDWRFAFVGVDAQGKPVYSRIAKPGEPLSVDAGGLAELYLVVCAIPTNLLAIDMTGDFRSFEQEPFPYMVKLQGGEPLDVLRPPRPTVAGAPHANGGGFVENRAQVAASAYVGPNAQVLGNSKVLGQARILDYAVIRDSTVRDHAVVSGHALVVEGSVIQDYAKVRDFARINRGAVIRDQAKVLEHAQQEGKECRDFAVLKGGALSFGKVSGTAMIDGSYCKGNEITKGKWFTWSWGTGKNAGEIDEDFGGIYLRMDFEKPHPWMAPDDFGATWGYLAGKPGFTTAADVVSYKSMLMEPEGIVPTLEGKPDFADNFVELLAGYLIAPADGDYTFWIAADDEGEFWLGQAGSGQADRKLCGNPFYAEHNNFHKFPSQKSAPVRLEKGKAYPLKVLHGDGHMGDSLSVAWTKPGADKPEIIGAPCLSITPDGKQPGVRRRVWGGVSKVADLLKKADYPEGRVQTAGGVLVLDGRKQFVELPADVADMRDITIKVRVKWEGGGDERIFEFANGKGDCLSLTPSAGGNCVFAIRKGATQQFLRAPALKPGKWTDLMIVLKENTGTLAVDGKVADQNPAITLNPDDIEATQCYLGRGVKGGYFKGMIDCFEIYSVPLTDQQPRR